ncbi:putative major facilitator superfamily transporter [Rosellinia necatrix]|uniref:Putative major facilitator superfamily transporter n=1 Tax=Rosellinia necatrix TaxID=77044 RepID=A0A1S8A8G7_ROSNE|nr:putative major facilitator superfamily transporter [Rosellinia necatrix]
MIIGNGVGIVFQPTLTALQSHVARSRRAVIISNRNFFRSAGGATGLAISAAVLQAALKRNLPEGYQDLANTAYSLPKGQGPGFEAVLDAYMAASRAVFILQVPVIGVCLLASVFLKDHGLEFPEERGEHEFNEQLALRKDPNSIEKSEAVTPIAVPFNTAANISDEEGQHDQAQPTPNLRV